MVEKYNSLFIKSGIVVVGPTTDRKTEFQIVSQIVEGKQLYILLVNYYGLW